MNIVTAEGVEYLLLALAMLAALLILMVWILYHVFFYRRKDLLEIKIKLATKEQELLNSYNDSIDKSGFTALSINELSKVKSLFFERINKVYLKSKK